MLGNGFAFALLPVLRRVHEDGSFDAALERHTEHFNAHPYLVNLALGATARMEAEGRDGDVVRRFKKAVAGPLGGLGDTLVWATLLPATMLVALILAWAGASPWVAVTSFLVLYNVGHLALRIWGFRAGLREGQRVAAELRRVGLGARADELARVGSFLAGVLLGMVLVHDPGLAGPRWLGAGLGAAAVVAGLAGGHRVWRPAALALVGAVVALTAVRFFL